MTRVLYTVEVVLACAFTAAAVRTALWVYRLCTDTPLWLVAVAVVVGFVVRLAWELSLFGWVVACHGWAWRRIEER